MAFSVSSSSEDRPAILAEMNVTPLVDVMLVLLIIFMVTAPLLSRPLQLSLPQNTPAPPLKPAIVDLDIAADGSVRINQNVMSMTDASLRLRDMAHDDPRTVLTISASPEVDYQQVVAAIGQAHDAGIQQISWRGD